MSTERIIRPIRLPFTIHSAAPPSVGEEPSSWGKRLGVWWDDGPEGYGVVITGTVRSGAPATGKLEVGDRIVAADGQPIGDLGDLTEHLEKYRGSQIQLTVRKRAGGEQLVAIGLSAGDASGATFSDGSSVGATVPVTTPIDSLRTYVEVILSTPVQHEVKPEGVSADPEFGCLGAGLDFAHATVEHSELRAAILANEKRLENIEIESVEEPDQTHPKKMRKVGIRIMGRFLPTGESVRLEYRFEQLSARRMRSEHTDRAGVEESMRRRR